MTQHLSEDAFVAVVVGGATAAERKHVETCVACRTEVAQFSHALSSFRATVGRRIDVHVSSRPANRVGRETRAESVRTSVWYWLAATAVVTLVLFFMPARNHEAPPAVIEHASVDTDPDALMDAVGRHLSRTLPAPMEPLLASVAGEDVQGDTNEGK